MWHGHCNKNIIDFKYFAFNIKNVQTNKQTANIITNLIDDSNIFGYLRWKLCRW